MWEDHMIREVALDVGRSHDLGGGVECEKIT